MRLKETVSMDVLKEFGFACCEYNPETGFQRFTKHYGVFLVSVCNNHLNKAIQITLHTDSREAMEDKHIVASVHQINHDLCEMTKRGYMELPDASNKPLMNDWDAQIAANNPFHFMMES